MLDIFTRFIPLLHRFTCCRNAPSVYNTFWDVVDSTFDSTRAQATSVGILWKQQ